MFDTATERARKHRELANRIRQRQCDHTSDRELADLEQLARKHERMAANLERGWPAGS
jgi:hypothetical protein